MFILNGRPLPLDTAFIHDDIQYPANWLRLASQEEREAIGISELEYEPRPDDRFYWVNDNGNGTFNKSPKDLDSVKTMLIQQVKQTAGSILSQSDWKVIRAQETNTALDTELAAYRASIRTKSNDLEASINACETVEELIEVNLNEWPEENKP